VAVRVLTDTNAYVAFCKGEAWASQPIQAADPVLVPIIVLGELRAGFAAGAKSAENEKHLTRFLNSPRVEVLPLDEGTTRAYATLYVYLRRAGKPIPTNDLWIAALAYQHSVPLLTQDAHFQHLPQLALAQS
jgi:tRNA(fMet)-specific endonuclease VapC